MPSCLVPSIGLVLIVCLLPECSESAEPSRTRRADAFLGVHFDFHAGADCDKVGARTTPEMIERIIDKVRPDYLQIDCKGHAGYCSYPTTVGNPAPGFVGDPLRVWRDVTRRRGVALFMHYSGVWDMLAVKMHPDWAAKNGDGKPNSHSTSVFGPYVEQLMIPQLRELADEYKVDGVWIDGDCWGTTPDYSAAVIEEFCKRTGAKSAPYKPSDPGWNEWMDFHREEFRRYVRRYVSALKESHPDFQVISNWAFSDHMPEPVSADVTSLSGDFAPDYAVNTARFAGRCLEDQGLPWDLMSWSFSRKSWQQKPAAQLMQEAAVVLALGGGFQAYFRQDRDGAVLDPEHMNVMADVAEFCRKRQKYCHRSVAVPQIALLYSTDGHYRSSPRLFHPSGSDGVDVLRDTLNQLLQNQYAVQVLSEHQLGGNMSDYPAIIVPGWSYLEPSFRDELKNYARNGGKLLLTGSGPSKLFEAVSNDASDDSESVVRIEKVDDMFPQVMQAVLPEPLVSVTGSEFIDVSPRMLNDQLSIHLVNTSGPHTNPPPEGIQVIEDVGPVTVSVKLKDAPGSITLQPENRPLEFSWANGHARLTIPRLGVYSVLTIEP